MRWLPDLIGLHAFRHVALHLLEPVPYSQHADEHENIYAIEPPKVLPTAMFKECAGHIQPQKLSAERKLGSFQGAAKSVQTAKGFVDKKLAPVQTPRY